MSDPTQPASPSAKPPQRLRIHGREEVTLRHMPETTDGPLEAENPYWLAEEPAPHPDPELGCIQRGLCCRSSPGWFAPGEVEKAAELLGLSPDTLVKKFLIVDSIEVDGQIVHTFAPVKLDRFGKPALPTGRPVDALYRALRGVCVFFDGKGCKIYAARPLECQRYLCTQPAEKNLSHAELAAMWAEAGR